MGTNSEGSKIKKASANPEINDTHAYYSPNQIRKCMTDFRTTKHQWSELERTFLRREQSSWNEIQQSTIDFDLLAKKKIDGFLNKDSGGAEYTHKASLMLSSSLGTLLPPISDEEFQEYCALEIDETPLSQHSTTSEQYLGDSDEMDISTQGEMLHEHDHHLDYSPPTDGHTYKSPTSSSVQLLESVGIDLDELMKDFNPEQTGLNGIAEHLKELKEFSADERRAKSKKKDDESTPGGTYFNFLETPSLSKYSSHTNKSRKKKSSAKKKSFKLKKHASDNLLQESKETSIVNSLPIVAAGKGKNLPDSFMRQITESKSFDIGFVFGERTLSQVKNQINVNKRVNTHWSCSLEDDQPLDMEEITQAHRTDVSYSQDAGLNLPHDEDLMLITSKDNSFDAEPDDSLPDDLPTPYQDTSTEHTSHHSQKRRRVEMIRSLMDRVRSSNRSFSLPQTKPFIDRYLRDRVSGQTTVTIRFSSIMTHVKAQLRGFCRSVDDDILLRHVVVALLFSIHEHNMMNHDKQFNIRVNDETESELDKSLQDESCVIQYS